MGATLEGGQAGRQTGERATSGHQLNEFPLVVIRPACVRFKIEYQGSALNEILF